jgi:hypothetical protein
VPLAPPDRISERGYLNITSLLTAGEGAAGMQTTSRHIGMTAVPGRAISDNADAKVSSRQTRRASDYLQVLPRGSLLDCFNCVPTCNDGTGNVHTSSRVGRQSGPPGWRGELHQARDPHEDCPGGRVSAGLGGLDSVLAEAEPMGLDLLDGLGALVDQSPVQQREKEGTPRCGCCTSSANLPAGVLQCGGHGAPHRVMPGLA